MKIFFVVFALLSVLLAVYPFVFDDLSSTETVTGLPWQVTMTEQGGISVFGLEPGNNTLVDAVNILGSDAELAIVASKGEDGNEELGSLEMYYGHYRASLISGKMILQASADAASLASWKSSAVKVEYMKSGLAKKYILDAINLSDVLASTLSSITFIPAVNLDEEVVLARFGVPAETIIQDDLTHYLYPEKGLAVSQSDDAKEVIQYVHPAEFDRILQSLGGR